MAKDPSGEEAFNSSSFGSTLPPWSAAHAYSNLYGPKAAQKTVTATVVGNVRVTEVGKTAGSDYDTHHIVLDFGAMPFPVLEGQSVGVLPPGTENDAAPFIRTASASSAASRPASPRNSASRSGYSISSMALLPNVAPAPPVASAHPIMYPCGHGY